MFHRRSIELFFLSLTVLLFFGITNANSKNRRNKLAKWYQDGEDATLRPDFFVRDARNVLEDKEVFEMCEDGGCSEFPNHSELVGHTMTSLGYPGNSLFPQTQFHTARQYMDVQLNNAGDPFQKEGRIYRAVTMAQERYIVNYYAQYFWGIDPSRIWGYVTASGTEGNMEGLWLGREALTQDEVQPIFYASKESHYSVPKIARILNIKYVMIESNQNGEMLYSDLYKKLNPKVPALIVATIGTTMKGAIDSPSKIVATLQRKRIKSYYIHLDAALMGTSVEFLGYPLKKELQFAHSISVSGHKFTGIPYPNGIFLTWHPETLNKIRMEIPYIGSDDVTIMGSRSGHSVLYLLDVIKKLGFDGFKRMALECREKAVYLFQRLRKEFPELKPSLGDYSFTVVFRRPPLNLAKKWQLAVQKFPENGDDVWYAHIITMPHVTIKLLDEFLADLQGAKIKIIQA